MNNSSGNNSGCQLGKAAKRSGDRDSTDFLSSLPDFILHHILSLLDTKSAVQTSVLSRQWKDFWKNIHMLDISNSSFHRDDYQGFRRYVDGVMSFRYPLDLTKVIFTDDMFTYEEEEEDGLFTRVIKYAFFHNTPHLEIYLDINDSPQHEFEDLFGFISGCDLKTLALGGFIFDIGFESYGFRLLTDLELIGCMFLSEEEEVIDPFPQFPCLKKLVMNEVNTGDDNDSKILRISGSQLTSLDFSHSRFDNIEIYAPKLKSFILRRFDGLLEFYELTIPTLDHADVWVEAEEVVEDDYDYEYEKQTLVSLLHGLSNARSLMLGKCTIKLLGKILELLEEQPPPFKRLENLYVESGDVPCQVSNYFLKGSLKKPNIKVAP